jgi:hypothetical protein
MEIGSSAIANLIINFCDGDLDPDPKRSAYLAGELNP